MTFAVFRIGKQEAWWFLDGRDHGLLVSTTFKCDQLSKPGATGMIMNRSSHVGGYGWQTRTDVADDDVPDHIWVALAKVRLGVTE